MKGFNFFSISSVKISCLKILNHISIYDIYVLDEETRAFLSQVGVIRSPNSLLLATACYDATLFKRRADPLEHSMHCAYATSSNHLLVMRLEHILLVASDPASNTILFHEYVYLMEKLTKK